jgi:NAD(P)-dependent dehydrogenase (short-subunit alcohol dehydrogenase family)
MDLGLRDRIVVVTGASKGIGYACAHAFAEEGARVALVSRSRANLDAALAKMGHVAYPPKAFVADLAELRRRWPWSTMSSRRSARSRF